MSLEVMKLNKCIQVSNGCLVNALDYLQRGSGSQTMYICAFGVATGSSTQYCDIMLCYCTCYTGIEISQIDTIFDIKVQKETHGPTYFRLPKAVLMKPGYANYSV